MSSDKRIKWIDAAKGIGIILVVIGHISDIEIVHNFIYSFHMPLFFFLSGLTFKNEKAGVFFKKKAVGLILPYFIFAVLYALKNIALGILRTGAFSAQALKNSALAVLLCIERSDYMVTGMWFLPCLFVCEALLYLVVRLTKNKKGFILLVSTALCIAQYLLDRAFNYSLVWAADVALFAIIFMALGYVLKDWLLSVNTQGCKPPLLCILFLILNIAFTALNFKLTDRTIDFSAGGYAELVPSVVSAVCGIGVIIIISMYCQKLKVLSVLGKSSLFIYLSHYVFLSGPVISRLVSIVSGVVKNEALASAAVRVVYIVAVLVVCTLLSMIYNKIMNPINKKLLSKGD